MGNKSFNNRANPFKARRGAKHLSKRVNGETEPTQADKITEVQAKKNHY
ncbi:MULTISPECIES: YpzG family protein [Halobacillus]|nr:MULTISPECIES: YpzG family protein [Halobacillus]